MTADDRVKRAAVTAQPDRDIGRRFLRDSTIAAGTVLAASAVTERGAVASAVQAAALWVFDFSGQASTYDVTNTNAGAHQLQAIAAAKTAYKERD